MDLNQRHLVEFLKSIKVCEKLSEFVKHPDSYLQYEAFCALRTLLIADESLASQFDGILCEFSVPQNENFVDFVNAKLVVALILLENNVNIALDIDSLISFLRDEKFSSLAAKCIYASNQNILVQTDDLSPEVCLYVVGNSVHTTGERMEEFLHLILSCVADDAFVGTALEMLMGLASEAKELERVVEICVPLFSTHGEQALAVVNVCCSNGFYSESLIQELFLFSNLKNFLSTLLNLISDKPDLILKESQLAILLQSQDLLVLEVFSLLGKGPQNSQFIPQIVEKVLSFDAQASVADCIVDIFSEDNHDQVYFDMQVGSKIKGFCNLDQKMKQMVVDFVEYMENKRR